MWFKKFSQSQQLTFPLYYEPGTVLSNLHILLQLFLILKNNTMKNYYYPYFTDEEAKAQGV